MNRFRALTTAAAAFALAGAALAEPRPPSGDAQPPSPPMLLMHPESVDFTATLRSDAAFRDPATSAAPPDRNGGCQQEGTFLNRIAATTTQLNGTGFWPSDNFRPAGTSPVTLTAISFSAGGAFNSNPSGNIEIDDFRIVIYDDNNGLPNLAAPRATFDVSSFNGTLVKTPAGGFTFQTAPITINDYIATVTPTVLPAGQCYWIEIQATSGGFPTNGVLWTLASPASEGDGTRRIRSRTGDFESIIDVMSLNDLHFCMNFPLEPNNTGAVCKNRTLFSCDGQAGARCQTPDGTPTLPPVSARGAGFSADNFSVSQPTTITGGCFFGTYNATTTPALAAENFQLRIYASSASGIPDTSNIVATVLLTGGGATPNLTGRTASAQFVGAFYHQFTLATPIALNPGCYWMEIQSQTTTPQWRWMWTQNARSQTLNDSTRITVASAVSPPSVPAYAVGGRTQTSDLVWCLSAGSGAIERGASCPTQQSPSNTSCAAALALPLTGVASAGESNFGPISGPLPPSGPAPALITNPFGLWYSVIGDGTSVTISTCNSGAIPGVANTNVDTVVNVYCTANAATPCAGTLTWIAGNDQALPACGASANASAVTFPTIAGSHYLVYVQGFDDNEPLAGAGVSRGFWYVSAASDGTPVANPPASCVDLHPCRVEVPAGAVASAEACGSAVEQDNLCSNATVLELGQWGTGTIFGFDNGVDVDTFRINDPVPVPGSKFYTVTVMTETLVDVIVGGRGSCVNDDFPGIIITGAALPCFGVSEFTFQDTTGGDIFVSLQNSAERGPVCGSGGAGNRYIIKVESATMGVCCRADTFSCIVTPDEDPTLLRVADDTFNTCTAVGGTYLGNGTVCDSVIDPNNPNVPCEFTGAAPAATGLGVCCTEIGTCFTSTGAACTSVGQFLAGGSCTPTNPCTTLSAGRCCTTDGFCSITRQSDCVGTSTFTLNLLTCSPHTCIAPASGVFCCRGTTCVSVSAGTCVGTVNGTTALVTTSCGAGNSTSSCCFADYSHTNGLTIDDLFLYLNGYFASSPYANMGGDGVTAPNIDDLFLYINAYFNSCQP